MDAFISYRRETGLDRARSIAMGLKSKNYSVFFDCDSLVEGKFNQQIYKNIENSYNFVLVLSKNSLDRCTNEGDWVRLEIEHALKLGKNIIPVMCSDFVIPEHIEESIASVLMIQAESYNAVTFDESISKIINRLKDANGKRLLLTKRHNVSNTFYANGGMSREEKRRIKADYKTTQEIEERIFNTFLEGRQNVTIFNPAIYLNETTFKRYDKHEQITQVYGMTNSEEDAAEANQMLSVNPNYKGKIYVGNMEYENFEDMMDSILSENDLKGFDVIDLSLIIRDLSNPLEKIKQAVDRLNENGVIYVRELDHGMVMAYPDPQNLIGTMLDYIKNDLYSGDFFAGRKTYNLLKMAGIDDVYFRNEMISTVNMSSRERIDLMETYFSYVIREYKSMLEKEPDNVNYSTAIEWIEMHYSELEDKFRHPDFFFLSGFMFFYGIV